MEVDSSGLQRYSTLFSAVEINSTHYKHHMERTFQRWADSVPGAFRFAVKMHRSITHEQRLTQVSPAQAFLQEVSVLGDRLGPVLIQLPPSLAFASAHADVLFALREVFSGPIVLEPRHPSWAGSDVSKILKQAKIPLVAADPPLITDAIEPGGHAALAYFRLHGSPRVYWSPYSKATLTRLAERITDLLEKKRQVWVIFDNTASGAAAHDALRLQGMIKTGRTDGPP